MYLLISSNFSLKKYGNAEVLCSENQCATNIETGIRRCAKTPMIINPEIEVCNTEYICDNPITPYALLSNGGTDPDGICEEGINCPCVKYNQCPEYISSMFTSFTTPANYNQSVINNFPQIPVQQIANPQTQFCSVPFSWLTISNPGCNFVNTYDYTNEDILKCMNLVVPNCVVETEMNPCVYGTLAFIVDNNTVINKNTLNNILVGCVKAPPCDCGEYNFYNTSAGEMICSSLN